MRIYLVCIHIKGKIILICGTAEGQNDPPLSFYCIFWHFANMFPTLSTPLKCGIPGNIYIHGCTKW